MPLFNSLWDKYGCTKCNNYNCLVFLNDASDSKATFQNWITKYNMTCPGVSKDEGAVAFKSAVGSTGGGLTYLIKPDKTWKMKSVYGNESDLTSAGVKPHICTGADLEAPKVTVTSPTTATLLNTGSKHTIVWTATDNVGVKSRVIRFSSNNGSSWTLVDSALGNTGSYSWTVPNSVSKTCKIKIAAYDAAANTSSSESGIFEIQPATGILIPEFSIQSIEIKRTLQGVMIRFPFSGEYEIIITDISGKILSAITTSGDRRWYTVSKQISSGMFVVSVKSGHTIIVGRMCIIR